MWRENCTSEENNEYKRVIDALVKMCKSGQGQIGKKRVLNGIWNKNNEKDIPQEQVRYNLVLKKLSKDERMIMAELLENEVITGVFETLKILEENNIKPFNEGFEGSIYEDFIGRMGGWDWPRNND